MKREDMRRQLPFLMNASSEFRALFAEKSIRAEVPRGHMICMEQNQCVHLPIVVKGTARVFKSSDEGKELTLYRIEEGESCILTASCILNQIAFPANAVAQTDIEAILVSSSDVRMWMESYPDWQLYIFGLLSQRLASVIELVEEVAFQRMDRRLSSYLYQASEQANEIKMTHEAIASDLGTSREVISRLLKDLENQGILALSRGGVTVVERDKLSNGL